MNQELGREEGTPAWLEKDYANATDEQRIRRGRTAQIMIKTGAAQGRELDFILAKYPELGKDWVEATPDAQAILEEFKDSRRFAFLALAATFHLDLGHIYQALKHSPIRPYIGDFTIDRARPFWNTDQPVRVRVVEPQGVDLTEYRRNHYIERDLYAFSLDSGGYLRGLQARIDQEGNERQRRVLQGVHFFYQHVQDLDFPTLRKWLPDQLGQPRRDKSGNEIPFPSIHQKVAIIKAAQEGSLAVFDGTGSGKTGIGIGLVEYLGARRALVVCPANVKDTWAGKIKEYYLEHPGVIKIDNRTRRWVTDGEKYTLVSYELLIGRSSDGGDGQVDILSPVAHRLLESEFDLLVIDEAHYINNPNKRSDAVLELARRFNHRLVLTATPIRNSVDDIARLAYLLSPDDFSSPEALRELGQAAASPLSELLATKTIRRKTEDLLELPPFCPENNGEVKYVQLELNPTQKAIYDTIQDDSALDVFSKLRLLRLAAIDHNLVRNGKYKVPFEEQQAVRDLNRVYKVWLKQKEKGVDVAFNSDFLVTHGYKQLFVSAHLHYRSGIDQLIQKKGSQEVKDAWQGVSESTKFQRIRDLIRQRLAKGEKVVVFSGHFIKGILREFVDDATGEAITEDLYSYLRKEFPEVGIGRIDGEVTTNARTGKDSKREKERKHWQTDSNYRILLTSIPSSALGIDLTVNDGISQGVSIVGIDLPYTYADFWQMISRVYRFGQLTPVNVWITEALGTVDKGVHILIDKKGEISQELLDGLPPDELARRIMDRSKAKDFLVDYITSPKKELEKRFYEMRGQGVTANGAYLEGVLADGRKVGEVIAELYSRYWEYTYSGHTARLLQQVMDGLRAGQKSQFNVIADAGSGPLILDRVMRQESNIAEGLKVISLDINKYMLERGVMEMQQMGYPIERSLVLHRSMSQTGIRDGACDATVCSLAFHYSSSAEDRGKILGEANRILRLGGYYFITLPGNYLSPEQYRAFAKALKKFGFELDRNISGKVKALDHKDVPFEIWLVAARKIGVPSGEQLSMEEFRFNFEGSKISQYKGHKDENGNGKKQAPGQDRLVKHERFQILDPDNNFRSKGTPAEVLSRLGLGLDEETIRKQGYRMEVLQKQKKDGTTVIIRSGGG